MLRKLILGLCLVFSLTTAGNANGLPFDCTEGYRTMAGVPHWLSYDYEQIRMSNDPSHVAHLIAEYQDEVALYREVGQSFAANCPVNSLVRINLNWLEQFVRDHQLPR
jgi:hypothetical protein